jgi:hypothetical protein
MKPISEVVKLSAFKAAATPAASPTSFVGSPKGVAKPPLLDDPQCDRAIPERLVSFRSLTGAWELRRPISGVECAKLNERLTELDRALVPFTPGDRDRVDLALNSLLMGFRNQRRQSEDADAVMIGVLRSILRDYPAWAIEETWLRIAGHKSPLDPHWVPSDAEIAAVARDVLTPYRARRDAIKALLAAKVAAPDPPHPTREQLEQRLGHPFDQNRKVKQHPADWYGDSDGKRHRYGDGDGKHAQHVEADLAARRARRALEQQQPEAEQKGDGAS